MAHRRLFATTARLNTSSASTSASPPSPGVHAISGWRRAVLWPLGTVLKLWGRTLRFDVTPTAERHLNFRSAPVAFVLWHNRLFLTPEIFRRYRRGRPIYALISASQDGAWLTAFFSLVGMQAVRGSSSRFGREAATALVEMLRAGNDVGITPDGPRGPCYDFKPGALIVARRTHTPLLVIGAEFSSTWQLRSWDRFVLPKPFSRVRLHCDYIDASELEPRDDAAARISNRLRAINPDARADHRPIV